MVYKKLSRINKRGTGRFVKCRSVIPRVEFRSVSRSKRWKLSKVDRWPESICGLNRIKAALSELIKTPVNDQISRKFSGDVSSQAKGAAAAASKQQLLPFASPALPAADV